MLCNLCRIVSSRCRSCKAIFVSIIDFPREASRKKREKHTEERKQNTIKNDRHDEGGGSEAVGGAAGRREIKNKVKILSIISQGDPKPGALCSGLGLLFVVPAPSLLPLPYACGQQARCIYSLACGGPNWAQPLFALLCSAWLSSPLA